MRCVPLKAAIKREHLENILPLRARVACLSIFVLVLGVYGYPAIRTTLATRSRALPPISAPDLTLYLNISSIHESNSGQIIDPYYGVAIPRVRLGYLKFRTSFLFFRALNQFLNNDLWLTVLLWNLIWWGLLCAVALWFFREFLPDCSPLAPVAGLAVLMFFNFGILQTQLSAWLHLPSLHGFQALELPYIRSFFPQLPVPLLLLYLGLQIKALQKSHWSLWVALAITQFLGFTIFPFAMLMMAGITAVALLGIIISRRSPLPWGIISLYAIACAASDLGFILHGDQVARSGAPGQYSLIQLRLSALPHTIGGMWLVLLVLTVGVFLFRDLTAQVKWPLLGLGITNLLLLMGDTVFSETALQVSHHAGYFVHFSAAILAAFVLSAGTRLVPKVNVVLWGIAVALLAVNGMLIAHATYEVFLPANEEHAALAAVLQPDPPGANDLVIARSLVVDDDCGWVPMLSAARVLYCRSVQVLLSPEQNTQVQRFRQALYLYFTNRDSRWVERVLADPNAVAELTRLTFLGQVTTRVSDRQDAINEVRTQLIPLLQRIEERDPEVPAFFSRYQHIFVIDSLSNPFFENSRLSAYLKNESQRTYAQWQVSKCTPARP